MTEFWKTIKEWGRMLSLIEFASSEKTLDSREHDLLWLLRSPDPRFRGAALRAIRHLRYHSAPLMSELVRLIEDEALFSDIRVAAADAFAHLVSRGPMNASVPPDRELIERLKVLLDRPQPSELARALQEAIAAADESLGADLVRGFGDLAPMKRN